MCAALALYKRSSTLRNQQKAAHQVWTTTARQLDDLLEKRYSNPKPTQRQRRGYVDFPTIIRMRKSLPLGSAAALLLAVYCDWSPLRADYNRVLISRQASQPGLNAIHEPNFLWLPPMQAKASPMLVLREYKTSRSYGTVQRVLPASLAMEIRASLKQRPRKWLFADKEGTPYSPKAFSKMANRTLESLFGRPVTLTLVRHAKINSVDFEKASRRELEEFARDMCHSVETQATYRWRGYK